MIDIKNLINRIQVIPQDNTLYLLEILPCETGIFTTNGNVLYIVPNNEGCISLSIKTEYLRVETNVYISAFNPSVSSFNNGYYNFVEFKLSNTNENDSEINLKSFVNMCLAHATYTHGEEFMEFFDSLVSLFQLPKEQQYKNLIGLMGELLLIENVYQNFNEDLSPYWHTEGSSSQLDFVCPVANFEVKTSQNDSSCFTIKHNQLFVNSERNYLVAISIEENNSGRTLEELINSLLKNPHICNNMKFSVNIEKERRRISSTEINSRHYTLKKIDVYWANDINPFLSVPECVEDLSYKLNLLPFRTVSLSTFFPFSNQITQ